MATTLAPDMATASTTFSTFASTIATNMSSTVNVMERSFSATDYIMFGGMMFLSALIGVYYGFYKKQDTVSEYLLGGQTMGVFPIAMSLIASNVSGITMLGVPAEIYQYGSQFFLIGVMVFPAALIVMYMFLPMFYKLQYTSSYEYLEHRFNSRVRQLSSVLFTIGMLLYMPVVIYVPCLALNQVSGISVHLISPLACIVCIFYTSLGGLKAVVWTDALQLVLLCLASIVVMILGIIRVGGLDVVFERASLGGRLELFNIDPSLYARCTFWNVGIGASLNLVATLGTAPSSVQRYLCVPNLAAARRTAFMLAVGYFITKFLSCGTGLIIFANYFNCDPIASKVVKKQDQLVPYFVMDVAESWPGLSGLFVAGVFSAALSTMSAGLNTLSGTLYKDFVEKCMRRKVSDKKASFYMKMISLGIGAFCVAMIFVVEKLGGVLQLAISLSGVTHGAQFGLFLLGMFFPWTNTTGALAGAFASLITMAVTIMGNSAAHASGRLHYAPLPTRLDSCPTNVTTGVNPSDGLSILLSAASSLSTAPPFVSPAEADVFPLFKISYFYFGMMGMLVTIIVGLIVSLLTGPQKLEEINPELLSPVIAKMLPKRTTPIQLPPIEEYKMVPVNE